jgi:hypothetical protein
MSQARHDLALRRERLLARSELARQQLEVQSGALLPVLALGDRARATVHWLRQHPEAVIALTVGVIIVRPRVAWRWGLRAWAAVRWFRSARDRLALFGYL